MYLLPMAYRCRSLFKMDYAEAAYIIEARTKVGGHFSYRHAAYAMYTALAAREPGFAKHVRASPRPRSICCAADAVAQTTW